VDDAKSLPLFAAAMLLAFWRRNNGARQFSAPDIDVDPKGTRWQVGGNQEGFIVYGQSNALPLIDWEKKKRELGIAWGQTKRRLDPYLKRLEEIKAQYDAPMTDHPGYESLQFSAELKETLRGKESDRRLAMNEERMKLEEMVPGLQLELEEIELQQKAHDASKPKDIRYMFKFDHQLTCLKVVVEVPRAKVAKE
jgi:hypothetical protein